MSISTAVRELEDAQQELRRRLADLNAQRDEIADELQRVDSALGALQDAPDDDDSTPTAVLEYTGKYRPLWKELCSRQDATWPTTFVEIESILGFPLPASSRKHLPHWYGAGGSSVARAILAAGWRATKVNLDNETLILARR